MSRDKCHMINVTCLTCFRVILANDGSVVVERGIIEPLEMDLTVMRCLENKSPIELTTNLKQITAHLGLYFVQVFIQ